MPLPPLHTERVAAEASARGAPLRALLGMTQPGQSPTRA